jgi:ATP-dependent DNA helicase DinG
MAGHIAHALHDVTLGDAASVQRAIAVIQAGTGVGKSAAYLATTVALALQRKTRVVISTATVALQEQLMSKDLPALAQTLDQPLNFALAKGRARYVCKLKLERLAGADGAQALAMFDADEDQPIAAGTAQAQGAGVAAGAAPLSRRVPAMVAADPLERRAQLYEQLVGALAAGRWDGDRDSLPLPPDARDWTAVAAERHSCTARHCPRFRDCSYYQARNRLSAAQVIVANHDLVLASLGMNALPELDKCLWVFDEAHHLPAAALEQFSASMDLSNLRWLERLPRVLAEVAEKSSLPLDAQVPELAAQLKDALLDLGRLAMDALRDSPTGYEQTYRLPGGVLPADWQGPLERIHGLARQLSDPLEALGAAIKARAKEEPLVAPLLAVQYAKLGPLAPRVLAVLQTSAMWLADGEPPLAKWLRAETGSGLVSVSAHAVPLEPGELLSRQVWAAMRGAVLTSATLTSCGSFDYFLGQTGLQADPGVSTQAVSSPFDYATQGQLVVVDTLAEPRQVQAFTQEMVAALLADLQQVARGALVLFTSRVQMQAAVAALPVDLAHVVRVQGQQPRATLLAGHVARVEAGLPSVVFGMQSFGEGLDLPGELCETVFITKLPFSPPSDPVEEARAEWLKRAGRDPFDELVVPATGIRLLQWTGRAIRSETDVARVVCYDKRLLTTAYGRRLLRGLPPYALWRRVKGVLQPVQL